MISTDGPRRIRIRRSLRETLVLLIIALAAVLFLRLFVFEMAFVDGQSMMPTLRDLDRVVVMKWTHYLRRQPKRGEIIVTKYPNREGYFIKRVIALPGDTIEIRDGRPYVNSRQIFPQIDGYSSPDYALATVPEGHIFVLGDNRANSVDSHNLPPPGFIPLDYLLGRADLLVWPLNNFKTLTHIKDE